jgi:hypothetical protein
MSYYKLVEQTVNEYTMQVAVNADGHYIGTKEDAWQLCDCIGIAPELAKPEHIHCSIGFCEKEQKWYGWSHRAIRGFGVGSQVKKGDCGYQPIDWNDFLEVCTYFWTDEYKLGVRSVRCGDSASTSWQYDENTPNAKIRGSVSSITTSSPEKWGRGEWKAETLDDAKQMAIDFARGVS